MKLLEKVSLGNKTLKNRVVMAPMTRGRADLNGIVSDLTVLYYAQRAGAGLIITESINISEQGLGSPFSPGIYTRKQILAWKKVTQAVHENGGVIYAQLCHTGRVGHSSLKNGELPVAPSAIGIKEQQHFTMQGLQDYETPRALETEEIRKIALDYQIAAANAMEAGFDGVELHAANGYLPNQFMSDNANDRTDQYGGSIENRNRFTLEVARNLISATGPNKVGVKLSPTVPYNDIVMSSPIAQFAHLIGELDQMPLAYINLMNNLPRLPQIPHYPKEVITTFGKLTRHTVIANGHYNQETGEEELSRGVAQLISYGTLFLANPDLPRRFELNAELNQPDYATMFGGGEKGYTDYPFLS